jgi:hypothetical protein
VVLGALLCDCDLRAALGARAFAAIEQAYTPQVVMRRLEAIYRDILEHRIDSAVA